MTVNKWCAVILRTLPALVAIALTLLGAYLPVPAAADGGNSNLVHACVTRFGQVRIVGPNDNCDPGERSMHWTLAGPGGASSQPPVASCPTGTMNCGNACISVESDRNNCGACGHVCSFPGVCTAGVCRYAGGACPAGMSSCRGDCVNVQTDPRNCGTCGRACQSTQSCTAGVCR